MESTCIGSGYVVGGQCCVKGCLSADGSCHCDFVCQFNGDCCADFEELACNSKYYLSIIIIGSLTHDHCFNCKCGSTVSTGKGSTASTGKGSTASTGNFTAGTGKGSIAGN